MYDLESRRFKVSQKKSKKLILNSASFINEFSQLKCNKISNYVNERGDLNFQRLKFTHRNAEKLP